MATSAAFPVRPFSPSVPLRVAARVLLLAAIALFTLELCARLDDYVSYGVPLAARAPSLNGLFRDTADGKVGVPYARYGKWQLNSLGLRSPELVPGRFTIACFGASETFGEYEQAGDEYPRVLERLLNGDARPRYQVVNAALPGLSIVTDETLMRRVLRRVRPQIAFVYPSPASSLWDTDVHDEPTRPVHWAHAPVVVTVTKTPATSGSRVRLLERVRELVRTLMPRRVKTWLALRSIAAAQRRAGRAAQDGLSPGNAAAYKAGLLRVVRALRKSGATPVLITHATRFGPHGEFEDPDTMADWLQYSPLITPKGILAAERTMNEQMRAVAREQHVALVDAADAMAPGPANFADFVHFTDAGAARFAALLAPVVRREAERTAGARTSQHEAGPTAVSEVVAGRGGAATR